MSFHHHLLSRRRHLLVSTRRAFFHQRGSLFSFHTNNNSTTGTVFWKNNDDRRRCLSFQQLQHSQQFQHQHQHQHQHQNQQTRNMNSWQGHGTDLLGDSLDHNDGVPKIVLHGHSDTGFDVINMIKNLDPSDENLRQTGGIVHCAGSILAFPGACFLWNVRRPEELTAESLAPVLLYRPELEYLFLGCSKGTIPHELIQSIRKELRTVHPNLVVEPLDITNTMGTFNVLNGEDRRVAAGLILIPEDDDDEE